MSLLDRENISASSVVHLTSCPPSYPIQDLPRPTWACGRAGGSGAGSRQSNVNILTERRLPSCDYHVSPWSAVSTKTRPGKLWDTKTRSRNGEKLLFFHFLLFTVGSTINPYLGAPYILIDLNRGRLFSPPLDNALIGGRGRRRDFCHNFYCFNVGRTFVVELWSFSRAATEQH